MVTLPCSLHPMDVSLLKNILAAMQGGMMPDLKAEATRRRQRDILYNWSQKVIHAATPLASAVSPDEWTLFTRLRPFFITAEDPDMVAGLTERLYGAAGLSDVLNLFREEVARLDPERADTIVDAVMQDRTPGILPVNPVDDIDSNLRAYLLYQRRRLEELETSSGATADQLEKAGALLAWRTCNILANLYPCWCTRATSLTTLATDTTTGLMPFAADPRGIFAGIVQRVPSLRSYIPYSLTGDHQTGLAITPKLIPQAIACIEQLPDHQTNIEVRALREALAYAQRMNAGLWEAAGMVAPDAQQIPIIVADLAEREDHPEKFAPTPSLVMAAAAPASAAPNAPGNTAEDDAYARLVAATAPAEEPDDTPPAKGAKGGKEPFWKSMMKKK